MDGLDVVREQKKREKERERKSKLKPQKSWLKSDIFDDSPYNAITVKSRSAALFVYIIQFGRPDRHTDTPISPLIFTRPKERKIPT